MKKHNFLFVGECAIVIVLLLLIGVLLKSDENAVHENIMSVVEETKEEASETFSVEEDVVEVQGESLTKLNDDVCLYEEKEQEYLPKQAISNQVADASISDNNLSENKEDKIQIVVFGDSIWGDGRGTDGISEQVMEQMNVQIYNCAIGGTTAAVDGESTNRDEWTSRSFNGMVYIARDMIDEDEVIPNDAACKVIKNVDFNEIDYVIVSYGLNDYFSDIPIYPQTYYDMTSYVGALRHGIHKLKKSYPHLEIILTSPTYCEWFKGERQFELGAYVEAARGVAEEMDAYLLDMYHAFGKNPEEKMEYLSDGVHLNSEGRRLYAISVMDCLKELQKEG